MPGAKPGIFDIGTSRHSNRARWQRRPDFRHDGGDNSSVKIRETRAMKEYLTPAAALVLFALALPSHAQAQTRVGGLECNVSGGVGFVITSSKALSCAFTGTNGRVEKYVGTIRKFGLDIGVTGPGKLAWAVFSPSAPGPGALAGEYVGASASVTAGFGVGANALVGGSSRTISLQPISVQVQTGVDLSAGVGAIQLDYVPER